MHGATATRRYVLHGSRALERSGFQVIAYDARGHGESTGPHERAAYTYAALAADALAVLDHLGAGQAALIGHSLGAATAAQLALEHPDRVTGLILVTPAHRGRPADAAGQERWERLADGLEDGGVPGFLKAYGEPAVPERQRDIMLKVITQRLQRHDDLAALAACLRGVFRGAAFDGIAALADITAPTLVVASRDEMDPDHPEGIARDYAEAIPGAVLRIDARDESPLAWRGGSLAQEIAAFLGDPSGRLP
jgi:pimeloyl-ACP methyl ester carboxylesterase